MREEHRLSDGDLVDLESREDGILLRPVRGTAGMRKKMGIWVLNTDKPISAAEVNRTIDEVRAERERAILGVEFAEKIGIRKKGKHR
jgi:hypothetical protein